MSSVDRVRASLAAIGLDVQIVELNASTRTAQEAAAAIGCSVSQIAKSLIFRSASGGSVLIIASGTNRVDEALVAEIIGEPIQRAQAAFVREQCGYAIGGVPPLGHDHAPQVVLLDADLLQYPEIWAAAGSPNAVMRLTPDQLTRMTNGRVVAVC